MLVNCRPRIRSGDTGAARGNWFGPKRSNRRAASSSSRPADVDPRRSSDHAISHACQLASAWTASEKRPLESSTEVTSSVFDKRWILHGQLCHSP